MKRTNGEGSIYENRQRKRFVAVHRADGVQVSATGKTQREAWEALDKKLSVKSHDVEGLPKNPTLNEWWNYARTEITLDGNERTALNRDANIQRYVLPLLGSVRLSDLRPEHGERLLREVARKGLTPSTQRTALKLARYVVNLAVQRDVLDKNVFTRVRLPRANVKRRILRPDEVRALQEAGEDDEQSIIPKLLLALGLRSGELCGLEWKHVHLTGKRPRVEIRQQLQKGKLDTPKCGQLRTLRLSSNLVEALEKHRAKQAEVVPVRGRLPRWDGHDFVVTSPTLAPLTQHEVREHLQRIGERAGISPHRVHGHLKAHELRYTAGSMLIEHGADIKEVSVFLGHRDIRTTGNIYIGLYETASDRLAELADKFIL